MEFEESMSAGQLRHERHVGKMIEYTTKITREMQAAGFGRAGKSVRLRGWLLAVSLPAPVTGEVTVIFYGEIPGQQDGPITKVGMALPADHPVRLADPDRVQGGV